MKWGFKSTTGLRSCVRRFIIWFVIFRHWCYVHSWHAWFDKISFASLSNSCLGVLQTLFFVFQTPIGKRAHIFREKSFVISVFLFKNLLTSAPSHNRLQLMPRTVCSLRMHCHIFVRRICLYFLILTACTALHLRPGSKVCHFRLVSFAYVCVFSYTLLATTQCSSPVKLPRLKRN